MVTPNFMAASLRRRWLRQALSRRERLLRAFSHGSRYPVPYDPPGGVGDPV